MKIQQILFLALAIFASTAKAESKAEPVTVGIYPIARLRSTGEATIDAEIARHFCFDYAVNKTWMGAECDVRLVNTTATYSVRNGFIEVIYCTIAEPNCRD